MSIFEPGDHTPTIQRRSKRVGWLMLGVTAVIALSLSLFPAPYVIDNPGPTYDTLGSVLVEGTELPLITVSGEQVFETTGQLRLTTVTRSGNPESLPGWVDVMVGWLDPTRTVIPVDVAYPPGVSVEENRQAAQIDMENSQQEAIAAALSYLDIPFTSRLEINQALEGGPSEGVLLAGDIITSANGILVSDVTQLRDIIAASGAQSPLPLVLERDGQVVEMQVIPRMSEGEARMPMIGILVSGLYDFPIDIEIALDNVGGPSAGLMFALGIVDKLAAEDITGGAVVAGTGVINADGEVGSIGGIRHKLYGARDDGATVFFAPEANCADIGGRIPEGLQVIPVATLDDALGALRALRSGGSVPQCPSP